MMDDLPYRQPTGCRLSMPAKMAIAIAIALATQILRAFIAFIVVAAATTTTAAAAAAALK